MRKEVKYTAQEFKEHLLSVIEHIKKYENYNVIIEDVVPENIIIYVKNDFGAIVIKTDNPIVVFDIRETHMTTAFWECFDNVIKNKESKRKTIETIKKYISHL